MLLTDQITELLFELRSHESAKSLLVLHGNLDTLRQKLLVLYRQTKLEKTREIIIEIMHEAGYHWFKSMVEKANEQTSRSSISCDHYPLSYDEFIQLIPNDSVQTKQQAA